MGGGRTMEDQAWGDHCEGGGDVEQQFMIVLSKMILGFKLTNGRPGKNPNGNRK